jgi:hypothetical protein
MLVQTVTKPLPEHVNLWYSCVMDGIEARAVPEGLRPCGLAHSQSTAFPESDFLFALHGRQLMQ